MADGLASTARVITAAAAIMVVRLRQLRLRRPAGRQGVRPRPGLRGVHRRHRRPHDPGAGHHGAARRRQLVVPEVAELAAQDPHRGQARRPRRRDPRRSRPRRARRRRPPAPARWADREQHPATTIVAPCPTPPPPRHASPRSIGAGDRGPRPTSSTAPMPPPNRRNHPCGSSTDPDITVVDGPEALVPLGVGAGRRAGRAAHRRRRLPGAHATPSARPTSSAATPAATTRSPRPTARPTATSTSSTRRPRSR